MKKQKMLQQQQQQQKMNTIKMMKLAAAAGPTSSVDGVSSPDDADEANMNANSIYLAGSNQQLILTNATNSLSRTVGPAYASTLTGMPNQSITVYELRKSKRLVHGGAAATANGTIRPATYVSPNGTLRRVNILTDDAGLASAQLDVAELKQQQLSGLQNPRNLGQLIGFGVNAGGVGPHAQPNDYCPSNKLGTLYLDDNATIKSSVSSSHRNHYLIPLNSSRLPNDEPGIESLSEQQQVYFQHMAQNTYVPSAGGQANVNFNYSSSDTENDSSGSNAANQVNQVNVGFTHMAPYTMSKRQVYTTNSFGRQPPPPQSKLYLSLSSA